MGEHRTTRGEPPPPTAREHRRWLWRSLAITVLTLGGIGAAGAYIQLDRYAPATGYVTTLEYAEVRAPVASPVLRIVAGSGDSVKRGDLLVQLEDASERAALGEIEREVRKSEAELAFREAELAERRRLQDSQIEAARLALDYARQRGELTRQLAAKGLASGRDLADDAYKLQVAEADYRRLQAFDATLDNRQVEVLRQDVAARREAVGRAAAAVDARAVRAPIDGRLLRYTFYAGEVVRPDTLLYEVFGGTNLILKLRVPERYATRVTTNQLVRAQFRSDRKLLTPWVRGCVTGVRDAIQTEGPQAYRVVYCSFDSGDRAMPPGATADAQIRISRSSFWASLLGL
jgi:multidrug resistance efflux pump